MAEGPEGRGEAPLDPGPRIPDTRAVPEPALLGVRALAALLAALPRLAVAAAIGGALGLGAGLAWPGPYEARAALQVGLLYPKEAIARVEVVAQQLEAAAAPVIEAAGDGALVAELRKGRRHPRIASIVDVTARADTASTAEAILGRALDTVLAEHARLQQLEQAINADGSALAGRLAERMVKETETAPLEAELASALVLAREDETGMRVLAEPFASPPSRVLSRSPEALRGLPRFLVFPLLGALIGALLAAAALWTSAVLQAPEGEAERAAAAFVRRLLPRAGLAALGLALVAAVAVGTRPVKHRGSVVLQSANVAPSGALDHPSVLEIDLEHRLEQASETLCGRPCALSVDVVAVRDQLTDHASTDVVRIDVLHRDPAVVRRALEWVTTLVLDREQAPYVRTLAAVTARVAQLRADLDHLLSVDAGRVDQVAVVRLSREWTATRRYLHPARSHPARVLRPIRIEPRPVAPRVGAAAAIGAFLGAGLAAALALLGLARSARRDH